MSMIGMCSICGRPAASTCRLCGRLVCESCTDPVALVCRACSRREVPGRKK